MILILQNQTASVKTYASGTITLPASGNVTVAIASQLACAVDGNLFFDVSQGNTNISDGVNSFKVTDALNYLANLISSFVNINDGLGNPTVVDNGQLLTQDTINTSYIAGIISVGTTPVQVKVGASVLVNRKYARIQPLNGIVYQGSSNAITSSSGSGKVALGQIEVKSLTDNAGNWWIVAAAGTVNVYVEEGS